ARACRRACSPSATAIPPTRPPLAVRSSHDAHLAPAPARPPGDGPAPAGRRLAERVAAAGVPGAGADGPAGAARSGGSGAAGGRWGAAGTPGGPDEEPGAARPADAVRGH